ncbi:MAG TPA: NHL repeat-containing protein [Solirubrobacteraceae bacterium]
MSKARHLAAAVAVVAGSYLGLAAIAAPTDAKIVHTFEGSFEGADVPGGPFGPVLSTAADASGDASNGDVYVAWLNGSFESFVSKFTGNGKYAGVQITGSETPQGSLSLVSFSTFASGDIAVDNSSSANRSDLYVADTGNGVVDKFSASGGFICQITGRPPAQRTSEEAAHECDGATGSETPQGSMEPTGIAVDSKGDVYVADAAEGHDVIDEFSASGEYMKQIASSKIIEPSVIAVSSGNSIYVDNARPVTGASQNVIVFNGSGELLGTLDESAPYGLGVDPSNGHIYVGDSSPEPDIAEFNSADDLIGSFGGGSVTHVVDVSVASSGELYAADLGTDIVDMFGPDVTEPDVSVGPAGVHGTTATLSGTVEPVGGPDVTACTFEYGLTESYSYTIPCSPAPPYTESTDVSANVTGLEEGKTYHFRISATNANGTNHGEDHTFGPASVGGETAEATTVEAVVRATVDPNGVETSCEVQYVEEAAFQVSEYARAIGVPCGTSIGWQAGGRYVATSLVGLKHQATYHYRVVATSGSGVIRGQDKTFTTFGIGAFTFTALGSAGNPFAEAGGHPYELVDAFTLNTSTNQFGNQDATDANPRDIRTELPPGLIGNPRAVMECPPYNVAHADCSGASQVGVLTVYTSKSPAGVESPIYNLVPPRGVAAQLGARFNNFVTVHIDAKIRTGGDYGVTAEVLNSSEDEGVTGATVVLWGIPSEAGHDAERYCPSAEKVNEERPCSERGPSEAFLTEPTACSGPSTVTTSVDPWLEQSDFVEAHAEMPALTGCGRLRFNPSITVTPDSTTAESPTGLHVDVRVPQEDSPTVPAGSELKSATVTLPEGLTVNPAGASGLKACAPGQIELDGPLPANCPEASKIGSVEIETPLLDHPVPGGIYVAQQGNAGPAQGSNPFGSLLAIYLAAYDPTSGVVVKLAGRVSVDSQTGQLITTFTDNPQLPFENLKLEFFDGSRASLATPRRCGEYTTTSLLEPWSHQPAEGEAAGTPDAGPSSRFQITTEPNGGCAALGGFDPTLVAGTANNAGASFSPFSATITRADGEQTFGAISLRLPVGIAGDIAKVTLCPEAEANLGDCPATSKIGHVVVRSGVGGEPITLPEPGEPQDPIYLTGPYKGAPFGLSIVVPAEAGPFNLDENGHPVVVRGKINVNPYTSQVSAESEPVPTMLQGIPLDVRDVEVDIDREDFMFNPTNCEPMQVAGMIDSSEGATTEVSSRFQAADCANLAFKPTFSAATRAVHTRKGGAYLSTTITSGAGQANIRRIHVTLPSKLPSRLETLKQACTESQFAANPAGCPEGAFVGTATVRTPVLPVPLTGPAIFVSHGGAGFPNLDFVLQGDGVRIIQEGDTFINKSQVTTSTFPSIPDVPVESIDLRLPEGPHSALAANGSLCEKPLYMPTELVGQNDDVVEQKTRIKVIGCKPTIRVVHHKVKGATATIVVDVPAAGKLIASGEGISRVEEKLGKATTARLKVSLSAKDRHLLARHPGHTLRVAVDLRFKPAKKGAKQISNHVTVLMK